MNIAMCHFRTGETDGVSLEMDKWKKVLQRMGHNVFYVSGNKGKSDFFVGGMDMFSNLNKKINHNCYVKLEDYTEKELKDVIADEADKISKSLVSIIRSNSIDLVIPNNIFSLGILPHCAIGFANALSTCKTKAVFHNHDFYWERSNERKPTCPYVKYLLDEYFPLDGKKIRNVVINSNAKDALKRRRNIDSTVIPNVLDFRAKKWIYDDFNSDLKEKLGINRGDITVLQATRVTERKAIENAVDFVDGLKLEKSSLSGKLYNGEYFNDKSRINLLMPGLVECESNYYEFINCLGRQKSINIIWSEKLFDHSRKIGEKGKGKKYSLWDAYVIADVITYPSILEGWGNQFLEGIFSRKPMVIYEYPVFLSDIKKMNFNYISLGSKFSERYYRGKKYTMIGSDVISKAVDKTVGLLKNRDEYLKFTDENFIIGSKYFSLESLEEKLKLLI